jgi:hypothetical protein
MLSEFLRSVSRPLRLAVLSEPSSETHEAVMKLWKSNHSVFPIVPQKIGYLTHLLTESKCEGLIVQSGLDEQSAEGASNSGRALGIPVLPLTNIFPPNDDPYLLNRRIILEGQSKFSTVPLACLVEEPAWSCFIDRNRQLFKSHTQLLSLSKNWLLDAESFRCMYRSSRPIEPETVVVDSASISTFLREVNAGRILRNRISKIVIDAPLSFEADCVIEKDNLAPISDICPSVYVRYMVPEVGPVGDLVPLHSLHEMNGQMENVTSPKRFSLYIGREATSKASLCEAGYFQTSFAPVERPELVKLERRKKRKIMAPDWRVRKVPIAVYHKKRGFKGQIYYTTKHKGWTFYKSRY